jgi:hypothetical protein
MLECLRSAATTTTFIMLFNTASLRSCIATIRRLLVNTTGVDGDDGYLELSCPSST